MNCKDYLCSFFVMLLSTMAACIFNCFESLFISSFAGGLFLSAVVCWRLSAIQRKRENTNRHFMAMLAGILAFMIPFLCRYFLRLSHLADAVVGLVACCGADVHLSCVQNKSCVCHFCGCLAYFYNICRTGMGVLYHKRLRVCRLGVIKVCLNFLPANHLNYAPVVCLSKHGKWPSKRYAFAA